MKWVKATDRLPLHAGKANKVIIRGDGFVTYGFKNFGDPPKLYYELANQSFLTLDVEWLDESAPESLADIEGDLLADLRNKMSPPLNLCNMLEQADNPVFNNDGMNNLLEDARQYTKKIIYQICKKVPVED